MKIYLCLLLFLEPLVSFILFILVLPIFVVIAFIIKVDSPGRIFFCQQRVGLNLRLFTIYKFRTMYEPSSSDSSRSGIISNDIYESRRNYKTTTLGDKRITRVGKFLRKSHLDELPQLINIFTGKMSFVGPRPDVEAQQFDYKLDDWIARHRIKPGITGYSQIDSNLTTEQRTRKDLYYCEQKSFVFDLYIIWLTFIKVLKRNSF